MIDYYRPHAVLAQHPEWTVTHWARLPAGERGRWYERLQTMLIDSRLTQRERRCTVAHEIEHALAGDEHADEKTERRRHRDAARKLIRYRDLQAAMLAYGEGDLSQVAEELHVDDETLLVRLATLHPSERHTLRRALEDRGEVA